MKHVSNEEKAREIVEQFETRYNTCDLLWQDLEDVALQAMKWKDKERKELWRITRNHYQEWAEEQIAQEKQKLIDEACKWLFVNDSYAIPTNVQVDRLREHLNNIK